MLRILKILFFACLIGIISWHLYGYEEKNQLLKTELANLKNNLEILTKENQELQGDINYFSYPENLLKELKSKFNYRRPDEKMMIIVP